MHHVVNYLMGKLAERTSMSRRAPRKRRRAFLVVDSALALHALSVTSHGPHMSRFQWSLNKPVYPWFGLRCGELPIRSLIGPVFSKIQLPLALFQKLLRKQ